MPEVWLRYGTTDVVLDIKFENLASQISSNFQALPVDKVKTTLENVPLTDNMLVVALSASKAAAKAVTALVETAHSKDLGITIDVPPKIAGALRSGLAAAAANPESAISINRIDHQSPLQERIKKFQSAILVSQVAYDPLFGFAGAPTALLRAMLAGGMVEAFGARQGNRPAPGVGGEPLKVAISSTEGIPATSVELVASSSGIAGIHHGSIADAFQKAVAQLKSISVVEAEPAKSAIISASGEASPHSTLAGSLNSLWNSVHAVREGGSAILLAECGEGVGGGALQILVEGRLQREQLSQSPYVDGLEHLLYIEELRQKYELGLVSTLPHYYARTRLGFSTYAGVKDALEKLQSKHGKSHRTLVLPDADITLVKPKA